MKKFKILNKYLKEIRFLVIIIIFLTLMTSAINLVIPWISKLIIDIGVASSNKDKILFFTGILIVLYVINCIFSYFKNIVYANASIKLVSSIKKDVFSHILNLPMSFFDNVQKGYIISRIDEIDALSGIFSATIFDFIASVISALGAIIYLYTHNYQILIILLISLPMFYIITNKSLKLIVEQSKQIFEISAKTKGKMQESMDGIQELKQFNKEKNRSEDFKKDINNLYKNSLRQKKITTFGSQATTLILNLSIAVISLNVALAIINKKLTVGDYVSIPQYAMMLYLPVQLLSSFMITIQPGLVALERIKEIFSINVERNTGANKNIDKIRTIEFENVSFKYKNDNQSDYFLQNVNFIISENEKVALVGKNGSGKSTIAKLLLGFYDKYEGKIIINNINLKDIDLKTLRDSISIISQNIFLFSGTLMENITMGNNNIDNNTLEYVLKLFEDDVFIKKDNLKQFYIMEGGKNLSGGQIQKIAACRAFIRNSSVLIFDEATANMDKNTKEEMDNIINTLFEDKICLIITHQDKIKINLNKILKIHNRRVECTLFNKMDIV